jgi:AcrR family transcriptional regulator
MLTLLEKYDITKITVGDLAELADIGRGTFYLHYQDPYDLLDKIEDEIIDNIKDIVSSLYEGDKEGDKNANMLICIEKSWEYVYNNNELIAVLVKNPAGYKFVEKCKECFYNILIDTLPESKQTELFKYKMFYLISGSWGIFQRWIREGMNLSPRQIAEILAGVIDEGNHLL